jgi:hypothetical protein
MPKFSGDKFRFIEFHLEELFKVVFFFIIVKFSLLLDLKDKITVGIRNNFLNRASCNSDTQSLQLRH